MVCVRELPLFSMGWQRDHAAHARCPSCVSCPPRRSGRSASSARSRPTRAPSVASTLLVRFGARGARVRGRAAADRRVARGCGGLPRRVVLTGLGLGAAGYSLQSGLYFAAIERLDVSLVALLLYTYPAFVTVAALALGRATPSLRIGAALAMASVGLVLVLLAAGTGTFDLARRAAGARRVADLHDVHPRLGPDRRRDRPVRARAARADRRDRELRGRRPGDRLARPRPARPRRGCGWC